MFYLQKQQKYTVPLSAYIRNLFYSTIMAQYRRVINGLKPSDLSCSVCQNQILQSERKQMKPFARFSTAHLSNGTKATKCNIWNEERNAQFHLLGKCC